MRLDVFFLMGISKFDHVGFFEDEMMLGVKLEANQDFGIEGYFLDFIDQLEQNLVLRVLPDDVTGFLHCAGFWEDSPTTIDEKLDLSQGIEVL